MSEKIVLAGGREPALSSDDGCEQAANANLRQAHDLLSDFGSDVNGDQEISLYQPRGTCPPSENFLETDRDSGCVSVCRTASPDGLAQALTIGEDFLMVLLPHSGG